MIPVEEIRAYVKALPADDPILEKMELAAVAFVERYTGHFFGDSEAVVETLSGPVTGPLYLREAPTDAVEVALYNGTDWVAVDEASYELDGNALWAAPSLWVFGTRNYRVTYMRGYEYDEVPADIRDAVMRLVAQKWKTHGKEGMKSESIGGYAYSVADARDVDALETLNLWRGPVMA